MKFDAVHGVNIAVRDLEHWTRKYEEVFGVEGVHVDESGFAFPGMLGSSFQLGAFNLNLISSSDPQTSVGRFLDRRGDGIFLLSVRVADVDAATEELRELGLTPLIEKPEGSPGHPKVNFVHPREMGGVQFEFIEGQD